MHGKRWTQKEEDLLRELYPDVFNHELEEHFGRTACTISVKASQMGIKKRWMNHDLSRTRKGKPWSEKELKRLKKLFPVTPTVQLVPHFPKRTRIAIMGKAKNLGLRKNYRNDNWPHRGQLPANLRIWSAEDIEKARTLWQQGYNKAEISRAIGKSFGGVSGQLFKQIRDLGLPKRYEHKLWSRKETAYLVRHYKNTPGPQISDVLGKKLHAIHHKAKLLNLSSDAVQTWTGKEKNILKKYYNRWPIEKLAKKLGRSIGSVCAKANVLNLLDKHKPWTAEDINFVKKYYKSWSSTKIAEKLGRSSSSISYKANELNLTGPASKPWTKKDIDFIKKYYKQWTNPKIAEKLGRSIKAVEGKAKRLNLMSPAYDPWTARETNILRKHYEQWSNAKIAEKLGRTKAAVATRAVKLGVRKK